MITAQKTPNTSPLGPDLPSTPNQYPAGRPSQLPYQPTPTWTGDVPYSPRKPSQPNGIEPSKK
jgi:hypothetical protein